MSLNEKQKAFCEYYASSFNATESAKRARYSDYNFTFKVYKNAIDKTVAGVVCLWLNIKHSIQTVLAYINNKLKQTKKGVDGHVEEILCKRQ